MFIDLAPESISVQETASMCGGIVAREGENSLRVCCVCTDSREIRPGALFLCLRGARADGHDYIGVAYEKGAAAVIAEYMPENAPEIPIILVENTIAALGKLAKAFSKGKIEHKAVVTGSVRKTTTKEMISAVLSTRGCFRTEGNFNSVIGMPMSLMTAKTNTPFAVFELGLTFDVGFRDHHQIDAMSEIVEPDVAVITNVGSSHLEHFTDRRELIGEKLSVMKGLSEGGSLICDIALKKEAPEYFENTEGRKIVTFSIKGDTDATVRAENVRDYSFGQTFDVVSDNFRIDGIDIHLYGIHNVQAALIAAVVGHIFGLCDDDIRASLSSYKPYAMRQEIIRVNGVTIINDCYNASPESMRAACDVLCGKGIGAKRKIALLGDMLELGKDSDNMHRSTGLYFAEHGLDYLFAFGPSSLHTADGALTIMKKDRVSVFSDTKDAQAPAEALCGLLREGDALLIKASRGIQAERITKIVLEYLKSDKYLNRKGEL